MTTKKNTFKHNSVYEHSCACEPDVPGRKAVGVDPEIKASNLRRLSRIEGQIRGLQRMVEEDRYCPDILTQVSSAQEALRAVDRALMRNHLTHCATHAIRTDERQEMYDELLEMIYKNALTTGSDSRRGSCYSFELNQSEVPVASYRGSVAFCSTSHRHLSIFMGLVGLAHTLGRYRRQFQPTTVVPVLGNYHQIVRAGKI
jgi:DNA-binding FrmR family transcriptional regulator